MNKLEKVLVLIFSIISFLFWPLFYIINFFKNFFPHIKSILFFMVSTSNDLNFWLIWGSIFIFYFFVCTFFSLLFITRKSKKSIFNTGIIQFSILIIFLFFDIINRFYLNHHYFWQNLNFSSFPIYFSATYFFIITCYLVILLFSIRDHYFYFSLKANLKNNHKAAVAKKNETNVKNKNNNIVKNKEMLNFLDRKFEKIFKKNKECYLNQFELKNNNIVNEKIKNSEINFNDKKPKKKQSENSWIRPSDYKKQYLEKGKKIISNKKVFFPKHRALSDHTKKQLKKKIIKNDFGLNDY